MYTYNTASRSNSKMSMCVHFSVVDHLKEIMGIRHKGHMINQSGPLQITCQETSTSFSMLKEDLRL